MTKYIIKNYSKATESNLNFSGEDFVAYYGKENRLVGYTGSHAERYNQAFPISRWLVEEYGYSRKSDAKRSWVYKNPDRDLPHWKSEVEIIKVEV